MINTSEFRSADIYNEKYIQPVIDKIYNLMGWRGNFRPFQGLSRAVSPQMCHDCVIAKRFRI